jgi:hypothetical protein
MSANETTGTTHYDFGVLQIHKSGPSSRCGEKYRTPALANRRRPKNHKVFMTHKFCRLGKLDLAVAGVGANTSRVFRECQQFILNLAECQLILVIACYGD